MTERKTNNLTNPDLWIRLLYMVVFGLLAALVRLVVLVMAALQFLLVLFTGDSNRNLRKAGGTTAIWTQQAYTFLTFASDDKPFPFDDWPEWSETTPESSADIPVLTPSDDNRAQDGDSHDSKP